MLQPVIMIGCGGSGVKAVRCVRDSVARHLERTGWAGGIPSAWQFIGIDLTYQADSTIPFLPSDDFVCVPSAFPTYQSLNQAAEARFGSAVNPAAFKELRGWRPRPDQLVVPLHAGAGQFRAVGRMAGVMLQASVRSRIDYAFTQCEAGGPQLAEVSRQLGFHVPPDTNVVPQPLTLIIGSMAGGTGAGIMLDVVELVRGTHADGAFPVLVAFTPDIFGAMANDSMAANTAAFMSEMMSAYWDFENTDSALIPPLVEVDTRGPHSVYLIGRKSIDGLDLLDSKNVYRAVGKTLAAVTTDSGLQTEFRNFNTVAWGPYSMENAGGYGFAATQLPGVVASFGSATLSIGRDRFRDYLHALLHRSIVEHLADGFEQVAYTTLGEDAARSMAGPAKIDELSRRNIDGFLEDCALQELKGESRIIPDRFVSRDVVDARLADLSATITRQLPTLQQSAGAWQQQIAASATQERAALLRQVDDEMGLQLREWGSELFETVLRATTEYSATLSIPVVLSMLEQAKAHVMQASNMLNSEAREDRDAAKLAEQASRGHLGAADKGELTQTAGPVQQAITDAAMSVCLEWSGAMREKLAVALESVATQLLHQIEVSLKQSLSRLMSLTLPQDGIPSMTSGWPSNDGVVPNSYAPSPTEIFVELYSTWPEKARHLVSQSLGEDRASLPFDPIEAARLMIIRGGFGGEGRSRPELAPFVWAESDSGAPAWEPGQQAAVKVTDHLESMAERIDAWMMRPATELRDSLTEGLNAYLMPTRNGEEIPDHLERLAMFRQQLRMALMQSRPLIGIDLNMNATVHPQPPSCRLTISGFPFGHGHPARAETEQVLREFLNDAQPMDHMFTSVDAESVLVTSFLAYPVNPSVVTGITQPLASAVGSLSPDLLRSTFWQWRRARLLENFIPLPYSLRIAAIRGFAVARILGTVSANPTGQNRIATSSGVHDFPASLLTECDRNNILPALLEAMVLAFADVPALGKDAFNAYDALIEYGTSDVVVIGFEIDGETERILRTGDHGPIELVDRDRVDALNANVESPTDRVRNAIHYIDNNMRRFDELDSQPMDPKSWRDRRGYVEPVDTLTLELLPDMRRAFTEVREALMNFERRIVLGEDYVV